MEGENERLLWRGALGVRVERAADLLMRDVLTEHVRAHQIWKMGFTNKLLAFLFTLSFHTVEL